MAFVIKGNYYLFLPWAYRFMDILKIVNKNSNFSKIDGIVFENSNNSPEWLYLSANIKKPI